MTMAKTDYKKLSTEKLQEIFDEVSQELKARNANPETKEVHCHKCHFAMHVPLHWQSPYICLTCA
jgi:hypothetical protein